MKDGDNKQIALVTGANGFIGSHLCEELLERGYSVRALVRKTSKLQFIEHLDLERIYGEITQPRTLPEAVRGVDYIFHPAGLVKAKNRETYFRVNAEGTRILVEAVLKNNTDLKRFVHISSQAAAGPSKEKKAVMESDIPSPVSFYGESKLASENEVLKHKNELPFTIIRPPAVYGPRDIDVYKFFKLAKAGINPSIGIDPSYVSIIHVSDLVECICTAAENDIAAGETFFVCNPDFYSIDRLIQIIGDTINRQPIKIAIPVPIAKCIAFIIESMYGLMNTIPPVSRDKLKELSQRYWICSPEKAARILGWSAKISVEDGMSSTAKWYKQKRWL